MRYRLGKPQVRRLINGGQVVDGHGKKYAASEEAREALKDIDDNVLYGRIDIIIEDGMLNVFEKSGEVSANATNRERLPMD